MLNKNYLLLLLCTLFINVLFSQINDQQQEIQVDSTVYFYTKINNSLIIEEIINDDNSLSVQTNDENLNEALRNHKIYTFEKAFPSSKQEKLKNVYSIICADITLINELETNYNNHFYGIGNPLTFTPNDLVGASPIGTTNKNHLQYMGMEEAWDITRGNNNVIIGIADAYVDENYPELIGQINNSLFDWSYLNCDGDYISDTPAWNGAPQPNGAEINCWHGTEVAGIAIGLASNNYDVPGICHDCKGISSNYNYNALLDLSNSGAKIINASWVSFYYSSYNQSLINEIHHNGTVIVAGAGNGNFCTNNTDGSIQTKGYCKGYPASYDHVISVSTVNYKNEKLTDEIYNWSFGRPVYLKTKGRFSPTIDINPAIGPEYIPFMYDITNAPLDSFGNPDLRYIGHIREGNQHNEAVDILSPAFENKLVGFNPVVMYASTTSQAAPLVTGVVGLMYSVNYCLTPDEADSILKMGSEYVEQLPGNQTLAGRIGAGAINAHKSVEMAYQMQLPNGRVQVKDQYFYRWNFELKTAPYAIDIQNQTFKDAANVNFNARQEIILNPGTLIAPTTTTIASFKIDSTLSLNCSIPTNRYVHKNNIEFSKEDKDIFKLYPNPLESITNNIYIERIEKNGKNFSVTILDKYNNPVSKTTSDLYNNQIDGVVKIDNSLISKNGIYFVKIIDSNNIEIKQLLIK